MSKNHQPQNIEQLDIEQLTAQLEMMQRRIDVLESALESTPPPAEEDSVASVVTARSSRRGMLRTLGAATVGAAAGGLALAQPAAAADGDNLKLGTSTLNVASTTTSLITSVDGDTGFGGLMVTDASDSSGKSRTRAAIAGIATNRVGLNTGLYGRGSSTGGVLVGPTPLWLQSDETAAPSGSGEAGQFRQVDGNLYYSDGERWTVLAGSERSFAYRSEVSSVPELQTRTPFRVYDSRLDMGSTPNGPISYDQERTISVKDSRDVKTGAVKAADQVPTNASALIYNVTVVNTTEAGYLYVADSLATARDGSTVNWARENNGAVANGAIVGLAFDRQIKVFCGGPGSSTDFVIDVIGYYTKDVPF